MTKVVVRNWLWLAVNIAALLPLVRLVWMVAEAPLARGPIMFTTGVQQEIILLSGKIALVLLTASLACTPAARILGFSSVLRVRKSLGLWSCFYACFHALYFMGGKDLVVRGEAWLDVWQMLPPLFSGLTKTPYARYGAYALTLLLLLAATSNRLAMRNLGKNWKRLHRLVYLAAPLAVYHYWQREEYQNGIEPPDYWQPAVFAVVVGLLLVVRVPPVRRQVANLLNIRRFQRKRKDTRPATAPAIPEEVATQPLEQRFGGAISTNGAPPMLVIAVAHEPDSQALAAQPPVVEKELA